MIDALGFKGIWKREAVRNDADAIFAMFEEMERTTNSMVETLSGGLQELKEEHGLETEMRIAFLSDTIVIGVQSNHPTESNAADAIAVFVAGTLVAQIQAVALEAKVPLMYRGCISFGEFKMAPRYIVGPAVDEAAELMNAADAALVWCTPSAAAKASKAKRITLDENKDVAPLFFRETVPFKGGRSYETWVVSPFRVLEVGAENRSRFLKAVSATFSPAIDHEIKRQNTLRVLESAHKTLKLGEDVAAMKQRREAREQGKASGSDPET